MNGSSLPNHENHFGIFPSPQGLSEARRGKEVLVFLVTKSPRGRPFGGGDIYRYWGYGGLNPHNSIKEHHFHGKSYFILRFGYILRR